MELTSHLLTQGVFDSVDFNEIHLAEKLVNDMSDNSLALFDRGFYSLGLLNRRYSTDVSCHWLMPLEKNTQYEVVRSVGRQDKIIRLTAALKHERN